MRIPFPLVPSVAFVENDRAVDGVPEALCPKCHERRFYIADYPDVIPLHAAGLLAPIGARSRRLCLEVAPNPGFPAP